MKTAAFLMIGLNIVMASSPLWAEATEMAGNEPLPESAHLKKQEKKLNRMRADQSLDNERARQAQEDFRKGTAEMTGHAEQRARDVQDLKSVENQLTAGKKQNTLTRQSYKETVQKYGSADPRSAAARQSWKQSQQAMNPLLESRQTLKEDISQGSLLVHNEKTVLSVQKRTMDSNARYRAEDDRTLQQEEQNMADDRTALSKNVQASGPPPGPIGVWTSPTLVVPKTSKTAPVPDRQ